MGRKRTVKSKYKHESTGEYCTCAAYIAEIMCKRNAENKNEGSLPYKFWNRKPWNWTFRKQLYAANNLIKCFSEEAVVKAIHLDEFRGIFSLNHPKVISIIQKSQILLDEENAKPKQNIEIRHNAKIRSKSYGGGKNFLNKLRDIENGEKAEINDY